MMPLWSAVAVLPDDRALLPALLPELFLEGQGPLQVHRAALSILAGNVFPRPPFALRWRLGLLEQFVKLNRRLPIVSRRDRFSLFAADPAQPADQPAFAGAG